MLATIKLEADAYVRQFSQINTETKVQEATNFSAGSLLFCEQNCPTMLKLLKVLLHLKGDLDGLSTLPPKL